MTNHEFRKQCQKCGITLGDIAIELGLTQGRVSQLVKDPKAECQERIVDALGACIEFRYETSEININEWKRKHGLKVRTDEFGNEYPIDPPVELPPDA